MYNVVPHGIALVNPTEPSGPGHYKNEPFVVLGGASSVGQFGSSTPFFSLSSPPSSLSPSLTTRTQQSNLLNCPASHPSSQPPHSNTPPSSNLSVQHTSWTVTSPHPPLNPPSTKSQRTNPSITSTMPYPHPKRNTQAMPFFLPVDI